MEYIPPEKVEEDWENEDLID